MAQLERLQKYVTKNSKQYPKLVPALCALSEFVGHYDIKETVAKMVLFFLSQFKPLRRSKRKRKNRRAHLPHRRRRLLSHSDEEDEDYDPQEEGDHAKMALIALLTHSLKAGDDSSDDEGVEDPPWVAKCRERMGVLQGHFVHTLLLGKPGTGKTTFLL